VNQNQTENRRSHKKEFSEVAVLKAGGGALTDVLRDALGLVGGMRRYVKDTDTVFIKPNLTAGAPTESGGTTDVRFTEAVVELVKEAGAARIIVGECSGNESRSIESLTNLGYKDMCLRQGVEMADLDFAEFVEVPVRDPLYRDTLRLPKIFWESDVFISVPVLKTHVSAGITVAIKNSFGLIPDVDKLNAHRDQAIEQIIADIAATRPADLVFVDGRIGAEGVAGGTDFAHPIHAGLVLVSNDPVAADAVSTRLMMQNPRVKHVQWAAEKGAGNDRLDFILMRGLPLEEAQIRYMSPADQIMKETGGKVRICELGACSRCCSIAAGPVGRYTHNPVSLLDSVEIVTGPGEWDVPERINPRTLLLGECVQEKYRGLGKWIGGCPVDPGAYMKALAEFDIVCTKCEQTVKKAVEGYPEDELAEIRILASNKTVFQGKRNKAAMDDFLLCAGRCQAGYIRNHARRIHKNSDIDATEYAVHKDGCGVSEADVREGIRELFEKMKAKKKAAAEAASGGTAAANT
jgi:uncharacterized protein (DUF362 family)